MKWSLIYSYQVERSDGHRTFAESLAQIQAAESYGCYAALVSEHHFVENGYFPAPFVTMAAIAASTNKIKIGSGIVILPLYDPVHVAEHGAVLDVISAGRLILGVGQGYRPEEFDGFRVPLTSRPGRLREGVEVIRALWTRPSVTYAGKHYRLRDVTLLPQPIQKPSPPIWVAAKIRPAVELAAEIGDAWFGDPITPFAVLKHRLMNYKTALERKGQSIEALEFPLMREAYCADTDERAWKEARDPVLYIYHEYLDWGHMQDEDGRPVAPGDKNALELLRRRFIIGSPETCIRDCRRYRDELGVSNLVLRMKFPGLPHDRVMNSIRLWAEKVMPFV
jgi:alkanesulfonate monooxygenase SsuD/methylene tetrahydromethanopterin reductase-like flavin-dependent oxidoreductase (luciferase family)